MPKPERINFRLDPAARAKLLRACELTGLDEPTALRACIQAFIEHVEEHGGIWLPLAIFPKDESPGGPTATAVERGTHGLNEDEAVRQPSIHQPSQPRATRARAALRKMQSREKPKP